MNGANPVGSAVSGTGSSISFGNQTAAGTYTVVATSGTCTATMTGSATITADATPPNAVSENATVILDAAGNATLTTADIDNGSTDNCGVVTMSISPSTFDCSNVAGVSTAGNALQSDRTGYVEVANDASLNPLNEWTLETWVKITA